jgi:hypothetical protein
MNVTCSIRELVEATLGDPRRADAVRFVDGLLAVAHEVGEIKCTFAEPSALRFQTANGPALEIELARARSLLRTLCARLAVLCNYSGGPDVSLYGGEGILRMHGSDTNHVAEPAIAAVPTDSATPAEEATPPLLQWETRAPIRWDPPRTFRVRLMNTPGEHWFTIVAE